ncbi:hypothetical protein J6590_035864 [Homalodisca vitripennis]|nr:hypothetical protein J6590_035864 [Homalodisca vitripennis]
MGDKSLSFLYHRKRIGPRTDPCSSPAVTGRTEEVNVPTETEKRRFVKKCSDNPRQRRVVECPRRKPKPGTLPSPLEPTA